MTYIFSHTQRITSFVLMAIGAIAIIAGFATESHQAWSNLLWSAFFFTVISLAGTFFLAVQYAAEAGWSIGIKRIPEAMGKFLPYGSAIILLILIGNYIAGQSSGHFLYHWWDPELTHKTLAGGQPNPEYDKILAGKSGYLNLPFFFIRIILYFIIWVGFTKYFRKMSLQLDQDGSIDTYLKMRSASYKFLVLFAVTSSMMAWDLIMSLEPHWFSTLFGWYMFASLFVSGIAAIAIITVFLKKKGYLEHVNEHHLHNIGLFLFAFSVFWTYLWFSQFMLIWYANLPEEVTYFMLRQDHYLGIWVCNFFINFFPPFLLLMSRDAKRKPGLLLIISCIVLAGHWIDIFQMITPGVAGAHWHLGWIEIGTTAGFAGLFMFTTLKALSEAPLLVKNEPFMEESLQHTL